VTIPVLAFFVAVLLIIQGLVGIFVPDVFVRVVRLFQSPSVGLRRGSVAHRHRHRVPLRGDGIRAFPCFSASLAFSLSSEAC